MRTAFPVAVVASMLVAACNSPTIPPGNYGAIAGTITSTSGQPIAGALVVADFGPNNPSGPDGKYLVQGVPISSPNAPAHVEVKAPSGFRNPPARDDVQVVAGQTTSNINFTLQPL